MPVITPLSAGECLAASTARETGPMLVIASRHCKGSETIPDVWFRANEQRNEAKFSFSKTFVDIPTQADKMSAKRQEGTMVQLDMSVGSKILDIKTLAMVTGRPVTTDATITDQQSIEILSEPGAQDPFYQVALIPIGAGAKLDFRFGWVIDYAQVITDGLAMTFGLSTPIEGAFSFVGLPHPLTGTKARFFKSLAGNPLAILQSAASEYITAYPQT